MIACEYVFKEFDSKGGDEYLEVWASQADHLANEG
jgi:hypothetical protein